MSNVEEMDIPEVLVYLRPGELWTLHGDTFDGLEWHSATAAPTLSEVQGAWPVVRDRLAFEKLREQRDKLLAASDWTQVIDAPVDRGAWAAYRQKLRDLPETVADPANPDWPQPPEREPAAGPDNPVSPDTPAI